MYAMCWALPPMYWPLPGMRNTHKTRDRNACRDRTALLRMGVSHPQPLGEDVCERVSLWTHDKNGFWFCRTKTSRFRSRLESSKSNFDTVMRCRVDDTWVASISRRLYPIESNYSGMVIGRPIAILYFLTRKITAEGAEERRAFNRLFSLRGQIPGLVTVPPMSRVVPAWWSPPIMVLGTWVVTIEKSIPSPSTNINTADFRYPATHLLN